MADIRLHPMCAVAHLARFMPSGEPLSPCEECRAKMAEWKPGDHFVTEVELRHPTDPNAKIVAISNQEASE